MLELGVGCSTIREAVQALAHIGILEVRQGSGTYVRAQPSDTEPLGQSLRRGKIAEVHEARRAIEVEIAFLAAQRRTDADLAFMRAALDKRESCRQNHSRPDLLVDADLDFHMALARASGNQILESLYASFAEVIRDSLVQLVQDHGTDAGQAALHEQLYEALQDQNAELARNTVTQLLENIVTSVPEG